MFQMQKLSYTNCSIKEYISFCRAVVNSKSQWESGVSAWHLKYWRKILFIVCGLINYRDIVRFIDFLQQNERICAIVIKRTYILEQVTREWLYCKSSTTDRVSVSIAHFTFFQTKLTEEALDSIYNKDGIIIWSHFFNDDILTLRLNYGRFYRKEGLMAISLNLGKDRIYSVSFWIAPDPSRQVALWIGAIQGSKGKTDVIHSLTKYFYGYRPKNLMIYAVRVLAHKLGLNNIYAVSNYGSYVNTRFRSNRKLKMSLDEFWVEIGGKVSPDPRFFKIMLIERRKDTEEIPSHKRNLYRNRFILLDNIDEIIKDTLTSIIS